ncbi:protein-tyrosine kinase [Bifidobacterium pseudolongum subsp. globosum]|uniref:polysaccharide biosynthesis tyrosine autokinase n=2 Tax=Bifidobacterium TaxID=1678 RepID=UPI001020E17B|nr:polysaccharide biosynthesis tyrosine autokinase [Bifidobacterium sp.]MBQ2019789.1 polysaccharide biosynthesis tyrosine autokinase [Rikenellaceae bacterium]RYP94272.1 protein-tyrosine kinase [Bifidobacterium pseudolongum subsp. globosum]RYP95112.1 protein-tyrosine kinase [Bifidobacterium pseudolongum subsp. globosum]RYP99093.1 protein-tyrosine kinase [Bifidobacterium pseudolongum subsp. globosum]
MAEKIVEQQAAGQVGASAKPEGEGMTLSGLFGIMRKHIITIIITFFVVLGAAIGLTAMSPVEYTTTTQLFATYNDSSDGTANSSEQNSGSSYIMSQIKSYPALTTTQSVLQPVIDDLGLHTTVGQLKGQISVTNPTNTAFVNISVTNGDPAQAADIANAVAKSLSSVVENTLYASGSHSSVKLSIVQPAISPSTPSAPKWKLNILIGIVGGLILGVFAALLKDVLSKQIQDEDEISEYIDAPIIGRIPEVDLLDDTKPAVVNEPGSPIAEDFRRVRTNLSFLAPVEDTNCRLIVVTSTGASEGKTTTSVNIAAALAENGAKVLLIDADLRHPSVANKLDIDGSAGLTHVLSGQASVKDVAQRYWKPNLHVMPAGPKPPNASTLLNSPIMVELLNNAIERYDYVLIDTAPMVVANDAVIFVRRGGSLVMVCRRDQTLKRDLREISDELATLDLPASGVIFNCARDSKKSLERSNYYYYYSDRNKDHRKKRRFSLK